MDFDAHVAWLELEGRLLVEASRRTDLHTSVPTCPGWEVADLLAHIGYVHRWAARYVATAITEMVEEPDEATILELAPPAAGRSEWVGEGHRALVDALRDAPSDLVCWTFLAAPSPLAMWARRQAHETAVHRVDAELAAGSTPTPVDPELAEDGIDELLFAFFGRPPRAPLDVPGGAVTLGLEPEGWPERWLVRVGRTGVKAEKGSPGSSVHVAVHVDVRVRATPSELYLLMWHRRPLEGLDVEGPPELFEEVWGPRGVTWA